jgi:hypothetical protein
LCRHVFRAFGPGLGHGYGYHGDVRNAVKLVDGVDRIRRKMDRNTMLSEVHTAVSAVLREAPRVEMTKAKLPGDVQALRGLPAIGRGVRGEIPTPGQT